MTIWLLLLLAQAPADPPPGGALTLAEAVSLARVHSPLAAAARAQAEGALKAARVAGRLADPTLELTAENWRPGADGFVASTDLDVFAVVTQPLDLFTRGGRKAQLTEAGHLLLSYCDRILGQCQEACPNDVPVFRLFRLIGSKVQPLFSYVPGRSVDEPLPLTTFKEAEFEKVGLESATTPLTPEGL